MAAVPGNRSSHRRHHLLDQIGEGFPIAAKWHQRDEFVAAETSGHAAGGKEFMQSIGDCAEDGVAGRVPMQIVDRLESIEIDLDHGERRCVGAFRQGGLERLVEQSTVRQPGQRVVPRRLLSKRFGGNPRGDRLAQQDRFANRRGHRAQAHAAAHHHEVHQVVGDRKAAEAIEDAELRANDPDAGANEHERQELVELALSPSATFFEQSSRPVSRAIAIRPEV